MPKYIGYRPTTTASSVTNSLGNVDTKYNSGIWSIRDIYSKRSKGSWPISNRDGLNPDVNRANASLLLPLATVGGGELDVTDYSPLALGMTDGGAASWQTIVKKFYGGAASFPHSGTQQILSATDTGLQLGTSNWTIEFWYRRGASATAFSSVLQMGTGGDLYSMLVGYEDGGNLNFYIGTSGSSWASVGSMGVSDNAAFHHFSLSFNGSNVYAHRDGTLISTTAFSGTVYQNANRASIGFSSGGGKFLGYLQDLRIYKGVAKYGAGSFTPPDSILAS
jgi:hypothetical protein